MCIGILHTGVDSCDHSFMSGGEDYPLAERSINSNSQTCKHTPLEIGRSQFHIWMDRTDEQRKHDQEASHIRERLPPQYIEEPIQSGVLVQGPRVSTAETVLFFPTHKFLPFLSFHER